MSLSLLFNHPFTEAETRTSTLVPFPFDVAINGRPYVIDRKQVGEQGFRRRSIKQLVEQQDTGAEAGEASISRKDHWRRSQYDFSHGAGQLYLDRPGGDRARFRSSKGIDPWTKWRFSLLNDTFQMRSSANTNLAVESAGAYLYFADGQTLRWTLGMGPPAPTWSDANIQAGEAGQTIQSIASDGSVVYAALGANGIHRTTKGATTSTHFSDLQADTVGYEKGRVMAAQAQSIYNVTAAGAAPAPLFTHSNSDFRWVGFAGGANAIYAAGFSGDVSYIYRTAIKTDGTALDAPVIAVTLPEGEVVRSITGYIGQFIILGTDRGVRVATTASEQGDLQLQALIPTPFPVRAMEGQDRFIWFGWSNYDSNASGLGRLDLSTFVGAAPAYASDLMVPNTIAEVLSIATHTNKRVFTISGLGVYGQSTNLVSSGTIDSGLITFDIPDPKSALGIDVRSQATGGTITTYLSSDEGNFEQVGSRDASLAGVQDDFPVGQTTGDTLEIREKIEPANVASGLHLTGAAGNYISTPDSASLSITGDIDVRAKVALDDWTPVDAMALVAKFGSTSNLSWTFRVEADGRLLWAWSANGAIPENLAYSTVANTITNGTTKWVRVTFDVDNGAGGNTARFYLSDDGVTWTQFGSDVVTAGATSLFDSTAAVTLGARADDGLRMAGIVYQAEIRNGINGTLVAAPQVRSNRTVRDAQGNVWTINGSNNSIVDGATTGPVIYRHTLKAKAAPKGRNRTFVIPLMLFEDVDIDGMAIHFDPDLELREIDRLCVNQSAITFQMGDESYSVIIDDYEWIPEKQTQDKTGWQGALLVELATTQ